MPVEIGGPLRCPNCKPAGSSQWFLALGRINAGGGAVLGLICVECRCVVKINVGRAVVVKLKREGLCDSGC